MITLIFSRIEVVAQPSGASLAPAGPPAWLVPPGGQPGRSLPVLWSRGYCAVTLFPALACPDGKPMRAVRRRRGVGTQRMDFAEFYREAKDDCLRTVLVSVGDRDPAQELVAEAFARAWASWRTVSSHSAPRSRTGPHSTGPPTAPSTPRSWPPCCGGRPGSGR